MESSSLILFAGDSDTTTHLFNQVFANAESQASSPWVLLLMLTQWVEVEKEPLQALLADTDSIVDNLQAYLQVIVSILEFGL